MYDEGSLTASGLLYEANFDEWQKRISAAFVVKGKPELACPAIMLFRSAGRPGREGQPIYQDSEEVDRQYIASQISPALLRRMSNAILDLDVGEIYARLKKYCQPFRLFDLPPELRVNIYEDVIEDMKFDDETREEKMEPMTVQSSHRLPALLRTSRSMRSEVLPVYFAALTFSLVVIGTDHDDLMVQGSMGSNNGFKIRKIVSDWEKAFLRSSKSCIRRFVLHLPFQQDRVHGFFEDRRFFDTMTVTSTVELTFSEEKGLEVKLPTDVSSVTRLSICRFATQVEEALRKNKWKGELILKVLLGGGTSIWNYTNLKLEDDVSMQRELSGKDFL